jgi:hypothetical protein
VRQKDRRGVVVRDPRRRRGGAATSDDWRNIPISLIDLLSTESRGKAARRFQTGQYQHSDLTGVVEGLLRSLTPLEAHLLVVAHPE